MTTAQDGGKVVSLTHRPPLLILKLKVRVNMKIKSAVASINTRWQKNRQAYYLMQKVTLEFFIDIKSFRSHYGPGVD